MSFLRLVMSAALAGAIAGGTPPAVADEPARAAVPPVVVDGVDVEQVVSLGSGVPLNFTVFGTPGALVTLRVDGGRRVLELRESEAGVYEGSYLIDGSDAVRPESRVTASLQKNGAVAYGSLDEPLVLAHGTVPWAVAAAPAEALAPAPARSPVPSAVAPVRAAAPSAVTPTSRGTSCADCAVVESVRPVEVGPRGGVIGAIGGAIAGAILGKEAGEAHQRRVLTVLGAIGGALAGRQIEQQATQSVQYDVDLRLADGTVLKRRYEQAPPFVVGATIRLGASRITPAPGL